MSELTSKELNHLCQVATKAAMEAGEYIQSMFDKHYVTQSKQGGDSLASQVVTEVDIKAQEIILSHLNPTISDHDLGLLTEELTDDHSRHTKDYFWCIDPMDGTLPFTEHRTGYAVSIALISRSGDPVIGVVYIPDLGECYKAVKGGGVFLNESAFDRTRVPADQKLHFYMDISFQTESYYSRVKDSLTDWANENKYAELIIHAEYGGVRNAIGVLSSKHGCYFKFPKQANGCGSIWDYAATRLFFEELGLIVSNANGQRLNLNLPETTFLNGEGIFYATSLGVADMIIDFGKSKNF
ncbi:MAG: inositol monophosphatase family protein [Cyclobacteriaceae bacterium]